MNVIAALLVLLLAAGMLALIIYAIANKKWALLFIPAGLVMLLSVLMYVSMPIQVQHSRTANVTVQPVPHRIESDNPTYNPVQPMEYSTESKINVTRDQPPIQIRPKVGFLVSIIPVALVVLIIIAIVKKKWALLFIPGGLLLLVVLAGLWYSMIGTQVQYDRVTNTTVKPVPHRIESDNPTYNPVQPMEYSTESKINVTRDQPSRGYVQPEFKLPLFVMLALVTIVVLIVIAIVKKKWAAIYIPLAVAGVLLLTVVLPRMFMHSSSLVVSEPGYASIEADMQASIRPLPYIWSPGIEKEFRADVYYSKTTALRSIAAKVARLVKESALNGKPVPSEIFLLKDEGEPSQQLFVEAITLFKSLLPDTKFPVRARGEGPVKLEGPWVYLQIKESTGQPIVVRVQKRGGVTDMTTGEVVNQVTDTQNAAFKNGTIKVEINLPGRKNAYSVPFTEKPWVENFSAFKNSYPHRQFAVAYSQGSTGNSDAASTQVYAQAKRIIMQRISQATPAGSPMRQSLTDAELSRHGVVVDIFSQSLMGSSTPIYRHALLLDLSPDKIQPLEQLVISSNEVAREYWQVARQSWFYHIFSAVGIALAICVIYLILNAATRGYYTVVLRILTVIGIIVVVVVVLNLA